MESATSEREISNNVSRRRFLGLAGIAAGTGLLLSTVGCKKEEDPGTDIGSGDNGLLNYFYVLGQVNAAFYIQVVATPFLGMTPQELQLFTEVRDHHIAYREFLKNLLAGAAIAALELDFSAIIFQKRTSVLDNAINFEDTATWAVNGAGHLVKNPDFLTAFSKMGSVIARHSAAFRDVKASGSFATDEIINSVTGLDIQRSPQEVLGYIQYFVKTKLNTLNLPA